MPRPYTALPIIQYMGWQSTIPPVENGEGATHWVACVTSEYSAYAL